MSLPCSRERGLTLVELIISIVMLAVLLVIALPAYASLLGRTHERDAQAALQTALHQARLAAVARGMRVTVCPSDDGENCLRTTQWQGGWLVFVDLDRDGKHSVDEPILQVGAAQAPGVAILSTTGRMAVNYQADGSAGGSNVTFTLCDRDAGVEQARSLVVNQAGRIRGGKPSADSAATCIHAAGGAVGNK
jgi:type IV fimbrial biogenesis protein FimT